MKKGINISAIKKLFKEAGAPSLFMKELAPL
jgi:hypothetical protein